MCFLLFFEQNFECFTMGTKRVLKDQQLMFLTKLKTKSCDSSVSDSFERPDIRDAIEKWFAILPRSQDRMIFLQAFDDFVEAHPKSPDEWLRYFKEYRYCDGLTSTVRLFAERGLPIQFKMKRYPELRVDPLIMANEPKTVLEQKQKTLVEAKKMVDQIFDPVMSTSEIAESHWICTNPKCGMKGMMKTHSQLTSKGDEMNTIEEKCSLCGHKLKHSR